MSLTEFAAMLRRRAILIAVIAAAVIAVVAVWSLTSPTIYQAKATLFASLNRVQVGTPVEQGDRGKKDAEAEEAESTRSLPPGIQIVQPNIRTIDASQIDSYAELAVQSRVLGMAAERVDGETASSLAGKVSVSHPPSSQLIDIRVRDEDPQQAADIANAVGAAMAKFVADLERPQGGGNSPVNLKRAQPASPPSSPASPKVMRNIILAILGGLALGIAAAIVREVFDTRLRDPSAVRDAVDLPVLSTIDFDRRLRGHSLLLNQSDLDQEEIAQDRLAEMWSRSRVAEEFRQLRVNLQFFTFEHGRRSIMVTSSRPGEGKTTTAGNLAITMALAGEDVVLVDCDLRNPTIHKNLGIGQHAGVTDVLIGRSDLDSALVKGRRLSVLTAGAIPPNPTELLGSQSMADLVAQLHERFGAVIIDTPPSLLFADPSVLAPLCGATLLVVRMNHTDVGDLERAATTLRGVDAKLKGAVVNMVRSTNFGGSYYYSYYGGNGNGRDEWRGTGFGDLVPRSTNGFQDKARVPDAGTRAD